MVGNVRSFGSALSGSTDTGLVKSQLLDQLLFTVTQSIISILIEFTLVWVEIRTCIPSPESALWSVLALLLALGSRRAAAEEARSRAEGGRGRRGASVGGQGVRGRRRLLRRATRGRGQGAAGGELVGRVRGRRGGDHQLSVQLRDPADVSFTLAAAGAGAGVWGGRSLPMGWG